MPIDDRSGSSAATFQVNNLIANNATLTSTTQTTSLTTGALTVAGGLGVGGNVSSQSLLLGSSTALAKLTSTDDGTTNTTNISRNSAGGLIFGINPYPSNDTYLRIYRGGITEYLNIFAARGGISSLNNQYVIESVCPISGVSRPIRFRLTNTADSNSIDALQINGSGNISIGSTNDNGAKLQVNGTAQISSTLSVQGINNTGAIQSSDNLYFSSIKEIGNVYLAPNAFKNVNAGSYPYAMVPPVNRLLGADTNNRFTVSATNIASGSIGLLFDGNYDNFLAINQNTTSVITINFNSFTYSTGIAAITFYGVGNSPENILIEGQNSTNTWTTLFNTTTNTLSCVYINTSNTGNYPTAFRITLSSSTKQVRVTELEWFSNRTDAGELSYLPLSYSSPVTTKIPTLNLSSTTASISPTTGALTVAGGLGVGGNLNIVGAIMGNATLRLAPTSAPGGNVGIRYDYSGNYFPFVSTGSGSNFQMQHSGTKTCLFNSGGSLVLQYNDISSTSIGRVLINQGVDDGINSLQINGSLKANGGIQLGVSTQSTNYSLVATDATILANANSAAFTLTLPSAVTYPGKIHRIKKIDSSINAVAIATTASQTIDGAATTSLNTQYSSVTLVSDGANWFKF